MRSLRFPAIYSIELGDTDQRYVGSTVDLYRRWEEHKFWLRRGKHHATKLQRAWVEHGEAAFEFVIIERIEDRNELIYAEQYWIDILWPCYNTAMIAGNVLGVKKSPESIAKTAAANRGRKNTPEAIQRMSRSHKARFLEMTEEEINAWRAKLSLGQQQRAPHPQEVLDRIAEKLRGRPLDEEHRIKLSQAHLGNRQTPETKAKIAAGLAKTWRFVSPEGEVVEIVNLRAFCRENNLNSGTMQSVNNGTRASHKGWTAAMDLGKGKAVAEVEAVE